MWNKFLINRFLFCWSKFKRKIVCFFPKIWPINNSFCNAFLILIRINNKTKTKWSPFLFDFLNVAFVIIIKQKVCDAIMIQLKQIDLEVKYSGSCGFVWNSILFAPIIPSLQRSYCSCIVPITSFETHYIQNEGFSVC